MFVPLNLVPGREEMFDVSLVERAYGETRVNFRKPDEDVNVLVVVLPHSTLHLAGDQREYVLELLKARIEAEKRMYAPLPETIVA